MASAAYDATLRVVIRAYTPMTEDELRAYLDEAGEIDLNIHVPGGKSVRITAGTVRELTRAADADEG